MFLATNVTTAKQAEKSCEILTSPHETSMLLHKALKKITHLKEDIKRLSDELRRKEAMLSSCTELAVGQSKQISSLNSALQDTVYWDSIPPRQSACSTPKLWTEVVDRGRKRRPGKCSSPPCLNLANRYSVLADDSSCVTGKKEPQPTLQQTDPGDDQTSTSQPEAPTGNEHMSNIQPTNCGRPQQTASPGGSAPMSTARGTDDGRLSRAAPAGWRRQPPSSSKQAARPSDPSARMSCPQEALLGRPSAGLPSRQAAQDGEATSEGSPSQLCVLAGASAPVVQSAQLEPTATTAGGMVAASSEDQATTSTTLQSKGHRGATLGVARRKLLKEAVSRRSGSLPRPTAPPKAPCLQSTSALVTPGLSRQPASETEPISVEPVRARLTSNSQPAYPPPLVAPTTLLIGDSVIKKVRYFDALTHCYPGATVPIILDKLYNILPALPLSVTRIIIHVGTNDVTHAPSELVKNEFTKLFDFVKQCGKSVFISGPIPTLGRGDMKFSRIYGLYTWLRSVYQCHGVGFIDNFDLFWERVSFYQRDGIHPSEIGKRMLAENIQLAVKRARLPARD